MTVVHPADSITITFSVVVFIRIPVQKALFPVEVPDGPKACQLSEVMTEETPDTNILSPESVEQVRKKLLTVDTLPTISTMFRKILDLVDDEHSSLRDIEKVIRLDQVISTRIIKLINSPFYGYTNVTSIAHAISLLGLDNLRSVVLGASLSSVFTKNTSIDGLTVNDFWLHSIAVAYLSKILAMHTGIGDSNELFTLGLLHDIGKVMYFKVAPNFLQALLAVSRKKKLPLYRVELDVGISHTHLGWFLTEKWNFPPKISMVIKNHHSMQPEDEFLQEQAIVNLADFLTLRLALGNSGNLFPEAPPQIATQRLHISKSSWERIKKTIQEQREAIVKLSEELLQT